MYPHKPNYRRQSGAALALSLMMMAVLTIIGVVSMNTTLLELLMAGNMQFQTRALINAENTLVAAEEVAKSLDVLTDFNTTGRTTIFTAGAQDPSELEWDADDSLESGSAQDRYIMEYAGAQRVKGSSASWDAGGGGDPGTVQIIRVTAHSEGTKGTERMVQSVYIMK